MKEEQNELDMLYVVIEGMYDAPDTQLDATIVEKLKIVHDLPPAEIAVELEKILDECVYASLASDFTIAVLETAMELARNYTVRH